MTLRKNFPKIRDLLTSYYFAKLAVLNAGYEHEIVWQELRRLEDVNESVFLREAAWVVLSSGMRESVIRRLFPRVEAAFGYWRSAAWIVEHRDECKAAGISAFRHERKVDAILAISQITSMMGVTTIINALREQGPDSLRALPFLGPATSRHLAKNLGLNIAKPDRHLVRIAAAAGYESPATLCDQISCLVGDTAAVVDLVLWRFATLTSDYLDFFRQYRCPESLPPRSECIELPPHPDSQCFSTV